MSVFRNLDRELEFICPICGSEGYTRNASTWAYKRESNIGKSSHQLIYFCHYRCMRKYDAEYEEKLKLSRLQAAYKRHKKYFNSNEELEEYLSGRCCKDCRYFSDDMYGFSDCSADSRPVHPMKASCKKFKPKEGVAREKQTRRKVRRKVSPAETAGEAKT